MSPRATTVFPPPGAGEPEPDRALPPDGEGFVERGGVRIFYEVHGEGRDPTVLLLPGFGQPGRAWKVQVPYLARRFRAITFDPRGTGRSDRPEGPRAHATREQVADVLAVLAATGTDSVVCVGQSRGAEIALTLAADHPDRVLGVVVTGADIPLTSYPARDLLWRTFEEARRWRRIAIALVPRPRVIASLARTPTARLAVRRLGPLGLARAASMMSRRQMLDDFDAFLEWFILVALPDAHSTRQIESIVHWYRETGPAASSDAFMGTPLRAPAVARALVRRVRAPVLAIHGDEDLATPIEWARALVRITGGRLMVVPGCGHAPAARFPVIVNLAIREFVEMAAAGRVGAERRRTDLERELETTGGDPTQ